MRRREAPIDPALYRSIDAVLISHAHADHLDPRSLALLAESTPIIAPRGAGTMLRKRGLQRIEEVTVGDDVQVGPISIRATYADHSGLRFPFGPGAESLGFLIAGRRRVYFAGDTDIFPGMGSLEQDLDAALLPVWGWGPTLRGRHLSPRRAAEALTLLRPRLAIPIHWGTYLPIGMGWMKPRFFTDPPRRFSRYAQSFAPSVRVRVLPPGGRLWLGGEVPHA